MAYGTGGVGYSAQGNLRTTVTSLKASGSSKEDVVSSIVNSGRFSQWRELANVIRIIYDSLDGVAHATLTQTYDIHSQIPQVSLALLTGDSDFSPLPVGTGVEFQINTYTIGFQGNHQGVRTVANLINGGFVAVWQSDDGQDGSASGVYIQKYDTSYNTLGSETQVNSQTVGNQSSPSIAGLINGGFVVVWVSWQDGSGTAVLGQLYGPGPNYNTVGGEFQINTYTTSNQELPSIAELSNGGFVVVWRSNGQDGSGFGVYAQMYDANAQKVGSELQVNTYTTGGQDIAAVAGLNGGGFVVVWRSSGQDGDGLGVYAQVYDTNGQKVGSEFQVNTYTTGNQEGVAVAGLNNGGFVITWMSYEGQDGDGAGIFAQVYDANAQVVGGEFLVNTYTTGWQAQPSITSLGDGFAIAWSGTGNGDAAGIFVQAYDTSAQKIGSELQINTYTIGEQRVSSIAGLTSNEFVTTWRSFGQDGSNYGLYGHVESLA